MSLLDDLKGIDVSRIVDARGAIKVAFDSPALTAALSGGAARAALGDLGGVLDAIQTGDPGALLKPLAAGLGELHGVFRFDKLPVGKYATLISDGLGVFSGLLNGLDGDLSKVGSAFGISLDGLLTRAHGGAGELLSKALQSGGGIVTLAIELDRGAPRDARALADVALRALLPLPTGILGDLQLRVARLAAGANEVALPSGRVQGLVEALARVEAAAHAHDAVALTASVRALEQVRRSTIGSLRDDLTLAMGRIRRLDVASVLAPLARADDELRGLSEGLLDQITRWRDLIAMMRQSIEAFDPTDVAKFLEHAIEGIEAFIEKTILAFIDERVRRAVEWMRGLFRHIPIASVRAELTASFHAVAQAIAKADIGRYAREAHALLDRLQALISPDAIKADIRRALGAAADAINHALDGVIEKLDAVKAAVDAVAGDAATVVKKVVPALTQFNDAVLEIKAGAADIGLAEAGQKVVEQLEVLRQQAERLLTQAPLPEPLKEQVGQVVDFVRGIDLDAAFEPVRKAAAELALPDGVAESVDRGLAEAAKVIDNLIPARLVAGIEEDIQEALDKIAHFDPAKLLPDLSGFLGQAADAVERLAPSPELAAEVHAPFQKLLDLVDAAEPIHLLAPAIDAFDAVMKALPLPSADGVSDKAVSFLTSLGERAASALTAPLDRLFGGGGSGGGAGTMAGSAGSPAGAAAPAPGGGASPAPAVKSPGDVPPENLRPGDIIRFLGYIPGKLREALVTLEAGQLGDVLAAVDRVTAGLARDLRGVSAALWSVDTRLHGDLSAMLAPLAEHQARARLAVRASFGPAEIDLDGTLTAIALAGPGSLRHELAAPARLAREAAYAASAQLVRGMGAQLDRTAAALERCTLTRLVGDGDALLAALDPEPIAVEIDELFGAVLNKAPQLVESLGDVVASAVSRLRELLNAFNPGVQAQKFLAVLDVVREQIDALSPRRLAFELAEIHSAIRDTIAAFDPGPLVTELADTVKAVAGAMRTLNPATLAGDITFLDDAVKKLEAALPTKALEGIGTELTALGEELSRVDVNGLLDSVKRLGPEIVDESEKAVAALKQEVIALLESLHYANASASASVEVHA